MTIITALFGTKPIDDGDEVPYTFSRAYFQSVSSSHSSLDLIEAMRAYSGYVRQAAIARAVALRRPELLAPLAARLNDWVPQVRDAARSALITLLPVMPVQETLAILPAIVKLRSAGRHDHAAWLDAFERDLFKYLPSNLFVAALAGPLPKVARACFELLQRHAVLDPAAMIAAALGAQKDIVTSLRAAHLIAAQPRESQLSLYEAALLSPFGAVRTIGLRGVLTGSPDASKQATAAGHLLDPQSSVRAAAMTYLSTHGTDVRRWYQRVLAASVRVPDIRICLASLGAMRQRDDIAIVSGFVTHPVIGVRASAYAAWLKLAESEKDTIAAKALGDESERVKKLAMEMVSKHGAFIPFASACALLPRSQDWPRLMRLGGYGRWHAMEAVARIAPMGDAVRRAQLRVELESALNPDAGDGRPNTAQIAFLRSDEANAVLGMLAGRDLREVIERQLALSLARRY